METLTGQVPFIMFKPPGALLHAVLINIPPWDHSQDQIRFFGFLKIACIIINDFKKSFIGLEGFGIDCISCLCIPKCP